MAHTTESSSAFMQSMMLLQRAYIDRLKKIFPEILQLRNNLGKDRMESANVPHYYRLIHFLADSSATFGFPDISDTGQALAALYKGL